MKAVALLLVCLPLLAADATDEQGDTIKLSRQDVQKCAAGGGCVVVTVALLQALLKTARTCTAAWT